MTKVKNYLLGYKDMYIMQDTEYFNFSLDSVLLPNFVTLIFIINTSYLFYKRRCLISELILETTEIILLQV